MKRPIYYIKNIGFGAQKGLFKLFSWLISFLTNSIFILSFAIIGLTIYRLGFPQEDYRDALLKNIILNIQFIILIGVFIRLIILIQRKTIKRIIWGEIILFLILSVFIFEHFLIPNFFYERLGTWYNFAETLYLLSINSFVFLIEFSKKSLAFLRGINPSLLFLSSFIIIIVIGGFLLLLPSSTTNGISITDAFFTSTSAVCVTGLASVDTATTFTFTGKTIIMLLIQIGGLGIMTYTTFFGMFFSRSSSFYDQIMVKEMINSDELSEIFKTLVKILLFTLIIETIGFVLIWFSLDPHLTLSSDNIKFSIFHSISAFCNAGFSTKSLGLMDSSINHNYLLHTIIAFLIIAGGIGFPILLNYYKLFKHFIYNLTRLLQGKSYSHKPHIININSRIVIITTVLLIIFGMLTFIVFENDNTLKGFSWHEKIYISFFASVTPRTAGFNTIDYSQILPITALITMFLMWVGASPSGTGGGIKTSTFTIAILNIFSFARGKNRIEISRREVSSQSVRKAFATILLSIVVIGLAILLVVYFNPELDFKKIMFECFSAFGTVGLSMGITAKLAVASKWVLIGTMFLGRIGTLTLFVAFIRKVKTVRYKYPEDEIIIN